MNGTIYNQVTGESRTLPQAQAEHLARNSLGEWSFTAPLPHGWDSEVPEYVATMPLRPAERERYRHEKPFSSTGAVDVWQFCPADKPVAAGQKISTTSWPHATFRPTNETARRVLNFFKNAQKSRLPQSPWYQGRLRLDDGLSGAIPEARLVSRRAEPAVKFPIRVAGR